MKRYFTLFLILTASIASWSQTTIIDEPLRDGSLPAGWTQTDVTFTTSSGGYANFTSTAAILTTPVVDLSSFGEVQLTFDVAKFGSGGNGPITVEVSNDGGSTWTAQTFDSPTPTSSSYLTSGPTTITATGANVRIRFIRTNSASQKRLRDVTLIGFSASPEPDNHPTNFIAATGSPSNSVIDLVWDDATGTNLPSAYLILANTSGTFTDPVDGTDPAEDSDLSDGSASIEVAQGVQSASFSGLNASTQYFFKIFPYSNSGAIIDFKTDGTPQTSDATTDAPCGITALGSETISCTSNTSGSDNDFVTISIPYTGVDANAVVTILVDGGGETNTGNDPSSFTNGTLSFDAYEGAAWSVTISGGTCNLSANGTVNSNECDLLPTAFINEFHYDNIGGDLNEFIEIALLSTFAGSLSDFQVSLYNGNGGATYDTETLNNLTVGNTTDGFTFYTWNIALQNGAPDGIALSYQGILIEFISYEGSFTATNGDANGQTSTDVGVAESNSTTTSTESIQRTGSCDGAACPVGLSWTGPSTATAGAKNISQNLPIELISFQAQPINKQVVLTWQTLTEVNNNFMAIERSTDARIFEEIVKVQGAGTTLEVQNYSFIDEAPFIGTNYYRLRQVDFDGRSTYYEVVAVDVTKTNSIQILPNPVNDFTTLQFNEQIDLESSIVIYDMMGKRVFETTLAAGQSNIEINLSFLANGSYIIRLEQADNIITERFIKQ